MGVEGGSRLTELQNLDTVRFSTGLPAQRRGYSLHPRSAEVVDLRRALQPPTNRARVRAAREFLHGATRMWHNGHDTAPTGRRTPCGPDEPPIRGLTPDTSEPGGTS